MTPRASAKVGNATPMLCLTARQSGIGQWGIGLTGAGVSYGLPPPAAGAAQTNAFMQFPQMIESKNRSPTAAWPSRPQTWGVFADALRNPTYIVSVERALLALLLACGLRRHELAKLTFGHLQQREGHWAIVDLRGKAGHVRTIPVPEWVHGLLDEWTTSAGINMGSLFRRVSSAGRVWGEAVTEKLVWHVVKQFAGKIGVSKLAPHDLRRSCARLCRAAGGELEQIQFLLGHISVQTTERYLGCTQRIASAVNDKIGIEPGS
jgi:integrase